jgi:hypothetical protein
MREIFPGVFHWTAFHDGFKGDVSSYFVEPLGVVIDPMVPPEIGLAAFDGHTRPTVVVLTTGNHTRHADRFKEELDCVIRVSREGAERIGGALQVEPYTDHDWITPGLQAHEIDVLSKDEYALHLTDVTESALAIGDGLTNYGALGFFGDEALGSHPQRVKEGLKNRFRAQLERDFEHLLFAHGDPLLKHGKTKLRDFVTSPVGHEDFGQVL